MPLGPVQLLVVGFEEPQFRGEILAELERLEASDTIDVLDVVIVAKDETGAIAAEGDGHLAQQLLDGADIDLGYLDGVGPEELWSATDAIAPGGVAAVALLEHRWAIPLRDAIARAGGVPVADAWLAPDDLASIGLPVG